jgi:hypothetical protein
MPPNPLIQTGVDGRRRHEGDMAIRPALKAVGGVA